MYVVACSLMNFFFSNEISFFLENSISSTGAQIRTVTYCSDQAHSIHASRIFFLTLICVLPRLVFSVILYNMSDICPIFNSQNGKHFSKN